MPTRNAKLPADDVEPMRGENVASPNGRHSARERRYLFYSHDGLGLGHVRRNLAIAAALTEVDPTAAILVATSVDEVEDLGVADGVDVLKLPGMKKLANDSYASRRLPLSSKDVRQLRASLLEAAVDAFCPTVMVVDKHPLGIGGELGPALDALRAAGGRAALGLRDILDDPATVIDEWEEHDLQAVIETRYERLLVYGDRDVFDTVREYRLSADLQAIARYCGYVVHRSDAAPVWIEPPSSGTRPFVLATAGGGSDGFCLLAAFIAAAKGMPWDAVVVSGRQSTPDEQEALAYLAELAGVAFRPFVPTLGSWFAEADALVAMGGYNTLSEALAAGVPTVCVPRQRPRTEQLMRASALAERGLVQNLPLDELRPDRLRTAVCAALGTSRDALGARIGDALDLGGARTAARELLELAVAAPVSARRVLAR